MRHTGLHNSGRYDRGNFRKDDQRDLSREVTCKLRPEDKSASSHAGTQCPGEDRTTDGVAGGGPAEGIVATPHASLGI